RTSASAASRLQGYHATCFFFSGRGRHTRWPRDWSSDVCSSDLTTNPRSGIPWPWGGGEGGGDGMPERGLVVIPTYNEAANLAHLVPQVLAQDPRLDILIVDDNSPDSTGQLAEALRQKEPRLSVIHREGKLGLGTAYIAGFRWALERDYALVFEMD